MSAPAEAVRRPISVKIFGIALVLITLMACVTLVSSMSLRRVGQQLDLLSRIFIVLDQKVSDVRAYGLSELILIERLLQNHPGLGSDVARDAAANIQKGIGECSPEGTRGAGAKIRSTYPQLGDQQLVTYELMKLCAADKLKRIDDLVGETLSLERARDDASRIELLTDLRHSLRDIDAARSDMHREFAKYLAANRVRNPEVHGLLRENLDQRRIVVSRVIANVANTIDAATRDSAAKVLATEGRVQWLSWIITGGAGLLGLMIAAYLTRTLVKPVRDLVVGTKQIEQGNLNVEIEVTTADELAQLAGSFNRMVQELRQKEVIKDIFGKYVDPRVVAGLLDRDNFAQGGERQGMTVFFSDLESFTSLSEHLTPTGVVNLLNQYFTFVGEPIRRYQGIVDKYIGDSVMAFWGPPFTQKTDHAVLGCHAALEQRERLAKFQEALPEILGVRNGIPVLRVRMALATGEVTVGSIGSEGTRNYTVIGDTVNLASRLEGINKLYKTDIIINEPTYLLAKDAIEVRELDVVRVVGRGEPVRVYELLARKGELDATSATLRDAFGRALALYRAMRWEHAKATFEECLRIKATDGPSCTFVERIQQLSAHPPEAGWDGIWTATTK